MENSSSSTNADHPTAYLKEDDPLYPCTVLDEKYLRICYQYQSSHFLLLSNGDWRKNIKLCFTVPRAYQEGCFLIIGTNQVGYTQDLEEALAVCSLVQDFNLKNICIKGVMSGLGGRYVDNPEPMIEFCGLVEKQHKEFCYREMGKRIDLWTNERAKFHGICERIKDESHRESCRNPSK